MYDNRERVSGTNEQAQTQIENGNRAADGALFVAADRGGSLMGAGSGSASWLLTECGI
jgi:hypothetical protein